MRLTECYAENFGCLHHQKFRFGKGMNVFLEKNGWGKSTLAAFIKNMIYGMDYSLVRKELNDRNRYMPWNKEKYGGYLVFESNNKNYRIERTFGKKKQEDFFELYDADTNAITHEYTEDIGKELFGIDRDSFERSIFISLESKEPAINEDINARLNHLINGTDDANNYEGAMKKLDSLAVSIRARRGDGGLLGENEKRRTEIKDALSDCRKAEKKLKNIDEQLKAISEKRDKIKVEIEELAISHEAAVSADARRIPLMVSAGAAAAACLCIFMTGSADTVAGKTAAAAFLLVFLILSVALICNTHRLLSKSERDTAEEQTAGCKARADELLRMQLETEQEKQNASSEAEKAEELERQLEGLNEEKRDLEEQYRLLKLTAEILESAEKRLSERYFDKIKNAFEAYLRIFGGNGMRIRLDGSMGTVTESNGQYWPDVYLSLGYRNAVNVCTRLALTDAVSAGEEPFIIMDDPYAELDDEKLERALDFTAELSERRQVIYFTCSCARDPRQTGKT